MPDPTRGIRRSDAWARLFDAPLPVSTERLRRIALEMDGRAEELARGIQPHQADLLRACYALRAAADEIDRLRGPHETGR